MAQKTTIDAINAFIVGCKTDGVWDKITEAYLMAGVNFDGITVKLKGTGTLTNNNFVSGDYLPTGTGAGLAGDGSTKYLDTGLLDTTLNADDKSLGYYSTVIGTGVFLASRDSQNNMFQLFANGYRMPTSDAANYSVTTFTNHYFVVSRRGINDVEAYKNGVSVHTDTLTASATNSATSYWIFGNGKSSGSENSDSTLTFAHIGAGLTDTDAANLSTRVNTLMTALGCNVY